MDLAAARRDAAIQGAAVPTETGMPNCRSLPMIYTCAMWKGFFRPLALGCLVALAILSVFAWVTGAEWQVLWPLFLLVAVLIPASPRVH